MACTINQSPQLLQRPGFTKRRQWQGVTKQTFTCKSFTLMSFETLKQTNKQKKHTKQKLKRKKNNNNKQMNNNIKTKTKNILVLNVFLGCVSFGNLKTLLWVLGCRVCLPRWGVNWTCLICVCKLRNPRGLQHWGDKSLTNIGFTLLCVYSFIYSGLFNLWSISYAKKKKVTFMLPLVMMWKIHMYCIYQWAL